MNGCDGDPEKHAELCVTLNALNEREALGLTGGLIRANGKVVAFTLGEKAGGGAFNIQIEKAYAARIDYMYTTEGKKLLNPQNLDALK